jgi:nucleotide-binding universal stress UspA family protein
VRAVENSMIKPIVVGYDGSPAADAALSWAAEYAAQRGLPLRVVHAPAWPILRYPTSSEVLIELEMIRLSAERLLQEACHRLTTRYPGLSLDIAVTVGDPAQVLLHDARGATAMVLGSRGLGEFRDLVCGSVATYVAARAPCPVVIVPASRGFLGGRLPRDPSEHETIEPERAACLADQPVIALHAQS